MLDREKWFTHGFHVWEELIRVPLIVAGPGIDVATRVATPVSNGLDLLPTLCSGRKSFADLRKAPLLDFVRGALTRQQLAALEREAPERVRPGVPFRVGDEGWTAHIVSRSGRALEFRRSARAPWYEERERFVEVLRRVCAGLDRQ